MPDINRMNNKNTSKKQIIYFSSKQFLSLMKAVFLGNWVANAYRTEKYKREYESIEDYIFSLAPQFGFEKYVDHEIDDKKYYPTTEFEDNTDVHKLHAEYDENTFWDELVDRLGTRDFYQKYTKKEIENMSEEEWFEKLHECMDKYGEEFEKFGISRIGIKIIN